MPKETNSAKENLYELEKQIKKVIRKTLKDNTLDYTVQYTVSSLEPGKIKYAAQISSPAKGVEPITFVFDNYRDLMASLVEAEEALDRKKVEIVFHQSRINTYKNKIEAHEGRVKELEEGVEEVDDEIAMEEV